MTINLFSPPPDTLVTLAPQEFRHREKVRLRGRRNRVVVRVNLDGELARRLFFSNRQVERRGPEWRFGRPPPDPNR